MTGEQLEAAARESYESNGNRVKPAWDDLGEGTKDYWRAYVNRDPKWPFKYSVQPKRIVDDVVESSITFPSPAKDWGTPVFAVIDGLDEPIDLREDKAQPLAEAMKDMGVTITPIEPPAPARPLTLKEKLALKGLK